MPLKQIAILVSLVLLVGCERQPSEEKVTHPSAISGATWLRSEYKVVGREVKEYNDHSGKYVVLRIRYGDKLITAECGGRWTTETGEDLPSTMILHDECTDVPMGDVMLERTDWNQLYYFSGEGKHRNETVLSVQRVEIK